MSKEQIKQAQNNTERMQTYSAQLGRYKRAFRSGFYFEAMMIVYSILEDRLKSMLYYCGVFPNRNTLNVSRKVKCELKELLLTYGETDSFALLKIRGKMSLLKSILKWSTEVKSSDICDNTYLLSLKELLTDIDIGGVLDTLDEMYDWMGYRNEIMHAAMNKNIEALYNDLDIQVDKGYQYARFLDSQVKLMKKTNRVRKKMRMQNN